MTGLEKIIDQIEREAKESAEKEMEKTREEAEQILTEAAQEIEQIKIAYVKQTDSQVELLLKRGEAAAALKRRKILLKAKQQVIMELLTQAKEDILNLPEDEYFSLLTRMLKEYSSHGQCELKLSERDLNRVPDSFKTMLEQKGITLSKDSANIDGGFILSYGEIEENCSFEALIAASKEDLQDKISAVVFAESGAETEK